jgi:PIN domain nuclease of toxin-antitoxin system
MTPLLLDTIVLLWWLAGDGRLGLTLVHRMKLPTTRVYVSVASAWEICDLERRGLVTFDRPARECLPLELCAHRIEWLPIDYRHVFLAEGLPGGSLDTYDRLILAQAAAEGLELATANPNMRAPGVRTIEASTPDRRRAIRPAAAAIGRQHPAGPRADRLRLADMRLADPRLADPRPANMPPARPRSTGPAPDAWADTPMERPIPAWNAFPWGCTFTAGPGGAESAGPGGTVTACPDSADGPAPAGARGAAAGTTGQAAPPRAPRH